MNYLAHLYLSGDDNDLKIGNFIADHIKGKSILELPAGIRQGVLLHRKIDEFTDQHLVVLKSKERLRPLFRKYSPVIADIFYDHFLAINWNTYSNQSLPGYAENFYKLTKQYSHVLPLRTKHMLTYMIANNWLVSYATFEGIHNVLTGMSHRTAFESGMEKATDELRKNYSYYENEFAVFFEELQAFVLEERKALSA